MAKEFSAIGAVSGIDSSSMDPKEAIKFVADFAASTPTGTKLTADQLATVREALPAIGCEEVTVSDSGTLQGKGTCAYTVSNETIKLNVESKFECVVSPELDRGRMVWSAIMNLTKDCESNNVYNFKYTYTFISFGTDVEGNAKVLYNRVFNDAFEASEHTRMISKGGVLGTSKVDFSSNANDDCGAQWGFALIITCEVNTESGALRL